MTFNFKKALLLIAIISGYYTAIAQQRTCDLEVVCISPADTVIAEQSQLLRFEMINHGPDVMLGSDPKLYMLYAIIDDERIIAYQGTIVGKNPDDTVRVGGSSRYVDNYGIKFPFPDITEPLVLDFCVKIASWGFAPNGDTVRFDYHDPNPDNDSCCKKVVVMPNKPSSINNTTADDSALQLYPNPASNMLFISNEDSADDKIQQVTISDITGRIILERQFHNSEEKAGTVSISVAAFPEGMYNVQVQTGKTVKNKKIVISR